jgi:hypothetical protein
VLDAPRYATPADPLRFGEYRIVRPPGDDRDSASFTAPGAVRPDRDAPHGRDHLPTEREDARA